jgi:hypothetical protein
VASKAYYKSVSLFWTLAVPAVLFAVIWYAYRSPGWVGGYVQRVLGPVLDPVIRWADRII